MLNNISTCKGRKGETRSSRNNANHASRSGTVSRERASNNDQPMMYKEKYC